MKKKFFVAILIVLFTLFYHGLTKAVLCLNDCFLSTKLVIINKNSANNVETKALTRICSSISQLSTKPESNIFVIDGTGGGLGHKYISILYGVTYAILLQKKFYLILPEDFKSAINSCINNQITTKEFSNFKRCGNGANSCFSIVNEEANIEEALEGNVVLKDARIHTKYLYTEKNYNKMIQYGILQKGQTWADYDRLMVSVLLHPTDDVIQVIKEERYNLFKRPYSIGVHIRTGGNLADDFERVSMIDRKGLKDIPRRIEALATKMGVDPLQTTIYLSSDSTKVLNYIRRHLGDKYDVVTSHVFKRGHTTKHKVSTEKIKSALVDIFLLSSADGLIVTHGSGFGNICLKLSTSNYTDFIPVNRVIVQRQYYPFLLNKHLNMYAYLIIHIKYHYLRKH